MHGTQKIVLKMGLVCEFLETRNYTLDNFI